MKKLLFISLLALLALPAGGQSRRMMMSRSAAAAGGGGGAGYTLLANATANEAGTVAATTGAIDTTGASLIVIGCSIYTDPATISDSKGNTWVLAGQWYSSGSSHHSNAVYYCFSPNAGSGHTFSLQANYVVINVAVFSGGTGVYNTRTGNGSTSYSTLQPGSISPTGTELFVTGVSWETVGTTMSINSSFSILDQAQQGGNTLGGALAYKNSSSAENPTWTASIGANLGATVMASFR